MVLQDLFNFMELRAGRKTEMGGQLELPRVQVDDTQLH
jgi:hypothetical protein